MIGGRWARIINSHVGGNVVGVKQFFTVSYMFAYVFSRVINIICYLCL